ncbi:hypothetical protein [Magnetospirillum molischianum]|uniref:Uncharacterized protein n=1 Tax=Magnetospirillum molischianum DSM 120 TaxID=1150626 RepID=H8FRK5_MAGML|nr:hypothetical protein [Magnetospirillum molischianum]CCG40993.1 conserved hypothetical protein [Magnetospirillum molischianum DSM 120]
MGEQGPAHLRKITNGVLDALLQAAERTSSGRPLSVGLLEEIVSGLKESAAFDDFYRRSYAEIADIVTADDLNQRRANAFGRLMIHSLDPLFEAGEIDRTLIGNLFSFLHMVLGEAAEANAARCRDILKTLRDESGASFTWDSFFDDPEVRLVEWQVLLHIADLFKRFDVRKEWFIKLMHHRQNTVSVSSNAFYTIEHDAVAEPITFGEREFGLIFHAWFDPLENLSPRDDQAFRRAFGAAPRTRIGAFLTHLAGCPVARAGSGC